MTLPKGRLAAILRTLVVLGIAAFLWWRVARDWPTVEALRPSFNVSDLAASLAASVAALVGLPAAFALTLKRLGLYRREHRWFYGRVWLQAYLFRYVPGKVMLVVERVRLGAKVGLDAGVSGLLLAWETLLLLVGAGVVLFATLALAQPGDGSRQGWLLLGALGSVALTAAFPSFLGLLPRLSPRFAAIAAVKLSRRAQLELVTLYALVWLALGLSFFFSCRFFVSLPLSALPTVLFWFTGAYVAGLVSAIAPAGLGVREGIVALGLASTVGTGQAVALAVAGRLWMTLVELACIGAARAIREPPGGDDGTGGNGTAAHRER